MVNLAREKSTEVASGVVWIPLSITNACLLQGEGAGASWVLVDGGLLTSGSAIRNAIADHLGPNGRPAAIVLTHGHFDHIGVVRDLAEEWHIPVYAHVMERPYLTGKAKYPPPSPTAARGGLAWGSPLLPRGPINISTHLQDLPESGEVPHLPGWRWIHTPGHTPGHISLFRDSDRTLIAGDAFVTTRQESIYSSITRKPLEVNGPPAFLTPDFILARRSVQRLADIRPELALTGHGFPMSGEELQDGLNYLLNHWEKCAAPRFGRYSRGRHAIASRHGYEYIPPTPYTAPLIAASLLTLAGGFYYWSRARRE